MAELCKIKVTKGVYWVEAPAAGLYVLCGCPADSVKHLMKRGLIGVRQDRGFSYETGPNAILLSDVLIQSGAFANLAEFPVLQMLYRQGMLLPNHPNNTGQKPLLIGSHAQISAQMQYIYRGNYGLVSEEELMAAGVTAGYGARPDADEAQICLRKNPQHRGTPGFGGGGQRSRGAPQWGYYPTPAVERLRIPLWGTFGDRGFESAARRPVRITLYPWIP